MKRVALLIFLSYFLLLQSSCKKEEEKTFPSQPIPQWVRDYGWFEIGSYWIYQDSVTGQRDSVYVYHTYKRNGRAYTPTTPITDYEQLTTYAKSDITGNKFNYHLSLSLEEYTVYGIGFEYLSPQHGDTSMLSFVYSYPHIINKSYNVPPFGSFALKDTLPVYSLNGITYTDVKVYYNQQDGMMGYSPSLTWVAPGIGVIKKQSLTEPKMFYLVKSNVIKK